MQSRAHRLLIPLAALLAILPLLVSGSSCGHDFDFHLLSWLEASTQIAHGGFPHWAFTPAWNAGEPRFLFYPPLSWLLGATLGLVLPWAVVPSAFTWITLTLAGFTMRRFASGFVAPNAAMLAAIVYLANPYMLFTAYERTAYGELLAAAFIPLLFAAILAPRLHMLMIAAAVALIWLANAPAGVMSCYALAILALLRLCSKPSAESTRSRQAALIVGGTCLGLALAAAYLVPATYEQRFISADMATVEGMRIVDNTLFHHMSATVPDAALHDQVLATASTVALAILAGIALAVFLRRKLISLPLLLLAALIAILLTPVSLPIWAHLPELRFLQFPWRLTALLAPTFALTIASLFGPLTNGHPERRLSRFLRQPQSKDPEEAGATSESGPFLPVPQSSESAKRQVILGLAIATLLIAPAWSIFHQPCDAEDSVAGRVALFHSRAGTEPIDEYTPAAADGDALHPNNPPYWLIPTSAVDPINANPPADATPGPAPSHLVLTEPRPAYLVLNRRQYPLWQLRLNGQPIAPHQPERTDGLISVLLPAGTDTIDLVAIRTPDEDIGLGVTLAAGALALGLWRRERRIQPPGISR
jgi:hypothetical protein